MGLAVDWVRRRLYFSDYMSLRIETTDLDGGDRVVLLYDLSGPRHLTLFPAGGLMFWSSWGSPKPMIEMAGMDGKRRKEFVSEKLVSPGALAIDQQQRRLYWTDPGLGYIDSINVDGTDRREVLGESRTSCCLDVEPGGTKPDHPALCFQANCRTPTALLYSRAASTGLTPTPRT